MARNEKRGERWGPDHKDSCSDLILKALREFISQAVTQSDFHFSPSLEGMEILLLAVRRKDWGSRRPR